MAFHFAFLSEQEIISSVAAATAALLPKNSLFEMKFSLKFLRWIFLVWDEKEGEKSSWIQILDVFFPLV